MIRPVPILAFAFATFAAAPARAIPAFARAYDVPCSSCHAPVITRRSEFGDAFRKAGYHWPGATARRSEDGVELKGTAPLSAVLPDSIPLGVSGSIAAAWTNERGTVSPFSIASPTVTLLGGAALGTHVSFFGTWSGGDRPNELHVDFARIFGRPELGFKVGLFEQTTTLFKSNEAILVRPLLGSSALHGHVVSQARLGAEAGGVLAALGGRTYWALGAVQNGALGSHADVYVHLSQKIGGMNLLGEEPDVDLEAAPSIWENVSLLAGAWGYLGRVNDDEGFDVAYVRRIGVDAKLQVARFGLWGGAMLAVDRDPVLRETFLGLTWLVEASFVVRPWLVPVYLYQYQDSATFVRETQRHDLGVVFLVVENLRGRLSVAFSDDERRNETVELVALVAL